MRGLGDCIQRLVGTRASPVLAARRLDGARAPTLRGIRRSVKEVWRVLAKCHEIRNRGEYEGDLAVTERPVTDLIDACSTVAHTLDTLASH